MALRAVLSNGNNGDRCLLLLFERSENPTPEGAGQAFRHLIYCSNEVRTTTQGVVLTIDSSRIVILER